ncbi:MAG: hypothetical protein AB7V39_06910, partial [Nitrospiraceae bacterium]
MNFFRVQARFDDALELDPADGPSRGYLVRSREPMDMPPAASWEGVYELTVNGATIADERQYEATIDG